MAMHGSYAIALAAARPIARYRAECYIFRMDITSEQIRAGRALLRIEQEELARRAHVSAATVRRLESPKGTERVAEGTVLAIRRALEEAGIDFVQDGVRRRDRERDTDALYRELRAIAKESAAQLAGLPRLREEDLYDEDGLPR